MPAVSIEPADYITRLEQRVGKQAITIQIQQEMIEKLLGEAHQSEAESLPEPLSDTPVDEITGYKRPSALRDHANNSA